MYNGIEVDMLSLGNADSILVSFWNGLSVYRVLIDGGKKGDAGIVRQFLRDLKIGRIDDLLSTHHHDDHSGGLIELLSDETLKFGKIWSHVPQCHVGRMEKWDRIEGCMDRPQKLTIFENPCKHPRTFTTLRRSVGSITRSRLRERSSGDFWKYAARRWSSIQTWLQSSPMWRKSRLRMHSASAMKCRPGSKSKSLKRS